MWQLHPHWKKLPPLSQQPPSKNWGPVKPPFSNLVGGSIRSLQKGGGACTLRKFDWDWQTETWVINKVITYRTPRTLEFNSCPVFPLWPESSSEVWSLTLKFHLLCLFKMIIQDSRKVKRIMNYVSKSDLYLYFLM